MSMDTHVTGFKPPDAKFRKMKKIWDACQDADTDPPKEVEDYFEGEVPDAAGVSVDLDDHAAVKEYSAEMVSGLEVDLTKLPPDVKVIRFVNSW